MGQTMVMGVGNLLLSDDGVGIHVIHHLQKEGGLGEEIRLVDGGTCGLDLLQYLEGVERLVIVDAARMGQPAGTIRRIEGEQVPAFLGLKTSPHEINLPELLFAARLIGIYPQQVVVFGIQPESLETGLELTPAVQAQVETIIRRVKAEVGAGV